MASHLDDLRLQARALPELSGVYFWRDEGGRVLYIGKAINLRARVTSYFSAASKDRRTRSLLARARTITYEVTATELDALFRESALIKRELPEYNRALREPSRYWWLKFDGALDDPWMEVTREVEEDGSLYFGPFRSASVMRETMEFLHAVLPLRKCAKVKPRCRPCIYFQMHTCAAPALGGEHRQRHREAIDRLFDLLDGRSDRVTAWLEEKRDRLSEALLFELAAEVQGRLDKLKELLRKQTILDAAVQCRCVLVHQGATSRSGARLLLVAHGRVISFRAVSDASTGDIVSWVRAHEPIVRAATRQEGELDAATVLQRWLTVNRAHVRWVAIPPGADDQDLMERVGYALGDGTSSL